MKVGRRTLQRAASARGAALAAAITVFASTASLAGAAGPQDFTFDEPIDYPAAVPVRAMAIGDVNGDRLDDVVTFAPPYLEQAQELRIQLQNPDGTLATSFAVDVGAPATRASVGIGDFNEDGANDIAVGMGHGISMLLADGAGGFALEPYADDHLSTVEHVTDIDGDGHLDILSSGVGEVGILLGDGKGSFRTRTLVPSGVYDGGIAYGDVSGDGHGDIVRSTHAPTGAFSVAKGDGQGHFLPLVEYAGPGYHSVNGALAIGDFQGGSRNELVIGEWGTDTDFQAIRVYGQDGHGNLLPPTVLDVRPFGAYKALARDVNGDGRDDLVVGFAGEMALYLQDVSGLSPEPSLFDLDFLPEALASGDLDDDGCAGVALAAWKTSIYRGLHCMARHVASDFDGDSVSDLLWRNDATGANVIWKSANVATQQAVTRVDDMDWGVAGSGDFDGNGTADIVWHHRLTGAGTIWKSADNRTQQGLTSITDPAWRIVGMGDFDGDGKTDLLWRHAANGRNAIWKSGNYRTQQPVTGVTDVRWQVAGVGDFDGDGKSDILWRHATSGVNAIWRSGNYHLQQPVAAVTNVQWQVAGVGDFDGDGMDDVFWRSGGGANTIWRSAAYASQLPVPAQRTRWSVAAIADYDGNGKDDVAWRNALDGSNVIWKAGAAANPDDVAAVTNQDWVIQ